MIPSHIQTADKKIKLFVQNQENDWNDCAVGLLNLYQQKDSLIITIILQNFPNQSQFALQPLNVQNNTIVINYKIISEMQKQQQSILYLLIQIWSSAIALSFINEQYCNIVYSNILLSSLSKDSETKQLTWTAKNSQFLFSQIKQDLHYIDFSLSTQDQLFEFFQLFKKQKKQLNNVLPFFEVIKSLLLRGNKEIMNLIIESKDIYKQILDILSQNPFNNNNYSYYFQYTKMNKIQNILQINDQILLNANIYNIRIKYLLEVVICMFIELITESIFISIINDNNNIILTRIVLPSSTFFLDLKNLSQKQSVSFINICYEIWEIFKNTLEFIDNRQIKVQFYSSWKKFQLTNSLIVSIQKIVMNESQEKNINPMLWQKFLDTLDLIFSYDWDHLQIEFLQLPEKENQYNFMTILLTLLSMGDLNTKVLILIFVRKMILSSQNRKSISMRALRCIFKYFINLSFIYCQQDEHIVSHYLQFLLKIYHYDAIRTRRAIIHQQIIPYLNTKFASKHFLIIAIKLLIQFIQKPNQDLFRYLKLQPSYQHIRQKYNHYRCNNNIINSLFKSLFKAVERCECQSAKYYIFSIFFPNQSINQSSHNIL